MSPSQQQTLFFLLSFFLYWSSTTAAGCGFVVDHEGGSVTDMDGCDDSDEIQVTINGKVKTFKQHESTKGLSTEWAGGNDEFDSLDFVVTPSGQIVASGVDAEDGVVFSVHMNEEGGQTVTEMNSEDFGEELEPQTETTRRVLKKKGLRGKEDEYEEVDDYDYEKYGQPAQQRHLAEDGSIIDVMVVWSKKAECKEIGKSEGCNLSQASYNNMLARVNLAVKETNQAYANSGIHFRLHLAHAYRHETFVEKDFVDSLVNLRGTNDGVLDDVHNKRAQYGADVVSLIVEDSQYCGLGYLGPRVDLMFSVTSRMCMTGYFSFGHEIAHNMGANHDKGTTGSCNNNDYNSGYRDPQAQFRSIMAYTCTRGQCDNMPKNGCTRVQFFSTTTRKYNGKAIGNNKSNNARKLNESRVTVANFFPPVTRTIIETDAPTDSPTNPPTVSPTSAPTPSPTASPTSAPTATPTKAPSASPSAKPSSSPSSVPSAQPSSSPSSIPSASPSASNSLGGEMAPSETPSQSPSMTPTLSVQSSVSQSPSMAPSQSIEPSMAPSTSNAPSASPSEAPSSQPTSSPSTTPSIAPTNSPSVSPSMTPSSTPSSSPTASPTSESMPWWHNWAGGWSW